MLEEQKTRENGWEVFPCDLCESTQAIELPHTREYTGGQVLSICQNCGFIHAKKRRSAKAIADTWSNELYGDTSKLSASSYSARNPHVKARQTYIADFIDVHLDLKGKKLVDIGAGEGQFLEIAKSHGADVFGIEPSTKNCEQLKMNNFSCFNGTAEEFLDNLQQNPQQEKFDIATIMWTLECSQTPHNLLRVAYNMLKEDGFICIATGSRILVPFKKPLHTFLSNNVLDTHPVHFSFNTITGLLAKSGFKVIQQNPWVENDILTVIAQKQPEGTTISWEKDDYMKVAHFFERWHEDSLQYRG